jgi:hypothetical protein
VISTSQSALRTGVEGTWNTSEVSPKHEMCMVFEACTVDARKIPAHPVRHYATWLHMVCYTWFVTRGFALKIVAEKEGR